MAVALREAYKAYNKYVYLESDPRVLDFPFMYSPLPIITLVALYLAFILKWGPAFMENRKPFRIDKLVQVYDVIQVLVCSCIAYQGILELYSPFGQFNNIWCEPVDYKENELSARILKYCYVYVLLKFADLLDTVFFVLRKKNTHITFLHTYHHAGMAVGSWFWMRYLAGGCSLMFGWVNSMVHSIMYCHYFLTNWNPALKKNLWWKKYITLLQLAQFLFFTIYILQAALSPSCGYPKFPLLFIFPQNLLLLVLFSNFYKKTYLTPKQE